MPTGRAIARAQAAAKAPQAAPAPFAPFGGMGGRPSPLVAQYQNWAYGQGTTMGNPLPRDLATFVEGAFGPLTPIPPSPINAPAPGEERPYPRRWQFPVGWNMPIGQPGTEGLKLASFQALRGLADLYSIVRACIQVRKQEVLGMEWELGPTKAKAADLKHDRSGYGEWAKRRDAVAAFWQRPDPNYYTFQSWFQAALEDVLVVDALALHLTPPRVQGKGVLGSNLAALSLVDGTTIRPLLDVYGAMPRPPAPAWQQYLWGVPRSDLLTVISEDDLSELGAPVDSFRADQLLYLPYDQRSWTPYGFPGIERALIPVITGLQRQRYWLDYYNEGSIPGGLIIGGDNITTPAQARVLQDALNAIAGDQAYKHKWIVLPHGASAVTPEEHSLADQFDATLAEQVLMAYDVQPMEVGLMPGHQGGRSTGLGGAGLGQASSNINERKATKPFTRWLKATIFDYITQDVLGQRDMEWKWQGDEQANEKDHADAMAEQLKLGKISIDEWRADDGQDPWELPATSSPRVFVGAAPFLVPLDGGTDDLMDATVEHTKNPPPPPFGGQQDNGEQSGDEPEHGGPPPTSPPAPTRGTRARRPAPAAPSPSGETAKVAEPTDTPSLLAKIDADREAQRRELDTLRNYVRKHHGVDGFTPLHLDAEVWGGLLREVPEGGYTAAAAMARKRIDLKARLGRRAALIGPIVAGVAADLGRLVRNLHAGDHADGAMNFVQQATGVMANGYRDAYQAGAREVSDDYTLGPSDDSSIDARTQRQHGFLMGLAQDVLAAAGALGPIASRLDLYAASTQPAYEQGYATARAQQGGTPVITWNLGDSKEPCENCSARDGMTFTPDTLPGFPGDGDFDSDLCLGGPLCVTGESVVDADGISKGYERWYEGTVIDVVTALGVRLTVTPNHPVLTCSGWVPAGLLHEGGHIISGALGKSTTPSVDVQHVPATIKQVVEALRPSGVRVRESLPFHFHGDGVGSREVDIVGADRELSYDGQASCRKPLRKYVLSGDRLSSSALFALSHADELLGSALPTTRSDVSSSDLLCAFLGIEGGPASARMIGQQWLSSESGASGQSTALLERGTGVTERADLFDGAPLRPLLSKHLVDGGDSGAVLASECVSSRPLQVTIDDIVSVERRAFAGHVYNLETDAGWYLANGIITHNCACWLDYSDGNDVIEQVAVPTAAKHDSGPMAAGLAVVALDSGRVLMLQRALSDGDPAGGTWEFPGGKLEPGEQAWAGAQREWCEETGFALPDGSVAGDWRSPNGVYQGYVYTVPEEFAVGGERRTEADPDGDEAEALAWWDPQQLRSALSSLRPELADTIGTVYNALMNARHANKDFSLTSPVSSGLVPYDLDDGRRKPRRANLEHAVATLAGLVDDAESEAATKAAEAVATVLGDRLEQATERLGTHVTQVAAVSQALASAVVDVVKEASAETVGAIGTMGRAMQEATTAQSAQIDASMAAVAAEVHRPRRTVKDVQRGKGNMITRVVETTTPLEDEQ